MMDLGSNWSPLTRIKSGGVFFDKRELIIPDSYIGAFFRYWGYNKLKLKSEGYSITKSKSGEWVLSQLVRRDDVVETITLPEYTLKYTNGLHEWQKEAAQKLCSIITTLGSAIDGSDLGMGKTYTACAVARELDKKIFVVCPKAVMESWRRVITNHFKLKDSLVGIINYEMLRRGRTDSPYASYVKNRKTRRKVFTWKIPKNSLIIWDESQKLKGASTKNSETCLEAQKQGYSMLFCSATVATNPMELKTVGMGLKLFNNSKEYYEWLYAHGVVRGRFGLEFNNDPQILKKLHKDIFEFRGVRLTRDMAKNFPETQITAECYNMDDSDTKKINEIYNEMSRELAVLKKKSKTKSDANQLVAILRARQKVELIKVPLLLDMIEEGIENGMSVAVFVNFTETIKALSERLSTKCIVNGDVKDEERQKNIDAFQNDSERVILINSQAGGAGLSLHDVTGKHPRLSLISPNYSAVIMRQVTGRVWRDGAKSKSIQKMVFVAKTVEEKVCDSVNAKLTNLDLLNDGDLNTI